MKLNILISWAAFPAVGRNPAPVPTTPVINTEYILTTAMRDGNFVYLGVDGAINGVVNPALHAKPGERITVTLVNSGEGTHDIVFSDINAHSDTITRKGETTSLTFTVPEHDVAIEYYDSTHERLGMKGVLLIVMLVDENSYHGTLAEQQGLNSLLVCMARN
jgi:plastocyanin